MPFTPKRQRFPRWQQLTKGFLAGRIYYRNQWINSDEVERQLLAAKDVPSLLRVVQQWNGFFALYWETPQATYLITDLARSIPLFWKATPDEVLISDELTVTDEIPTRWFAEKVLTQTEFVPGHMTLAFGWQQLQAGEMLEIKDGLCFVHEWFSHCRPPENQRAKAELKADFTALIQAQTERLIQWADGRTIVVPLSGGYDSRYLVAALVQANYPNLRAFTYGQADSLEVQLAQRVAQTLDVDWRFVPYTQELLRQFWSDDWQAFAHYAGNCASNPQEQDYFALRQLKDTGWLPEDAIITPGYCGDVDAGSYLPGNYFQLPWRQKIGSLQQYLYHKFQRYPSLEAYTLWLPTLPQEEVTSEQEVISELERWVKREYLTKFIVNGVRAYEWVGCQWYLPLWDKEFVEFWQRVPNTYREGMQLYRTTLRDNLFQPLGIDFQEDHQDTPPSSSYLKDLLGATTKAILKQALPNQKAATDINGLHHLVPDIQRQLDWDQLDQTKSLNEMIGHWYLAQLDKSFNQNHTTPLL